MWIQLDGALSYYARIERNFLNRRYNGMWIGQGPIAWPARSPDLTLLDSYLWGYLKNVMYEQKPTILENTIQRIKTVCTVQS